MHIVYKIFKSQLFSVYYPFLFTAIKEQWKCFDLTTNKKSRRQHDKKYYFNSSGNNFPSSQRNHSISDDAGAIRHSVESSCCFAGNCFNIFRCQKVESNISYNWYQKQDYPSLLKWKIIMPKKKPQRHTQTFWNIQSLRSLKIPFMFSLCIFCNRMKYRIMLSAIFYMQNSHTQKVSH